LFSPPTLFLNESKTFEEDYCFRPNERDMPETVAQALEYLGPAGSNAVPDLVRCLDDPKAGAVLFPIHALTEIAPERVEAIPTLLAKLGDADAMIRQQAAAWLVGHQPRPTEYSPPSLLRRNPTIDNPGILFSHFHSFSPISAHFHFAPRRLRWTPQKAPCKKCLNILPPICQNVVDRFYLLLRGPAANKPV
jgi:hypothetical protein